MPPYTPSLKVEWMMKRVKDMKRNTVIVCSLIQHRLTYIKQQCPLSRPLIDLTRHNIRFCNIVPHSAPTFSLYKATIYKLHLSSQRSVLAALPTSWAQLSSTKVDSLAHSQLLLRDVLLSLGTGKQSHWTFQSLNNVFLSSLPPHECFSTNKQGQQQNKLWAVATVDNVLYKILVFSEEETSSQKLGRHALHRVRSVWKSVWAR